MLAAAEAPLHRVGRVVDRHHGAGAPKGVEPVPQDRLDLGRHQDSAEALAEAVDEQVHRDPAPLGL